MACRQIQVLSRKRINDDTDDTDINDDFLFLTNIKT